MNAWLKKITDSAKSVEEAVSLPETIWELLAEDFECLEAKWPGLPERIMRYLVLGESPEVLDELAAANGCGAELRLKVTKSGIHRHLSDPKPPPRLRFLELVKCSDAAFFCRLAAVWDAASRRSSRQLTGVFGEPDLEWLEVFLWEVSERVHTSYPPRLEHSQSIDASLVERMLQVKGFDPEVLPKRALLPNTMNMTVLGGMKLLVRLPGLGKIFCRYPQSMLNALKDPKLETRLEAVEFLKDHKADAAPFAAELLEMSVGPAKTAREAVEPLVTVHPAVFRPLLETRAVEGSPTERAQAVRLLSLCSPAEARPFLEKRRAEEKVKSVLAAIDEALRSETSAAASPTPQLPPLAPLELHLPLGKETQAAFQACFESINRELTTLAKRAQQARNQVQKPFTPAAVDELFRLLQEPLPARDKRGDEFSRLFQIGVDTPKALSPFFRRPEIKLLHLLRFLVLSGVVDPNRKEKHYALSWWFDTAVNDYRRHHEKFGLRELAAVLDAVGVDKKVLGLHKLAGWLMGDALSWEPEATWPYWAEHLDLLEEALRPEHADYGSRDRRLHAFKALQAFPQPPARLLTYLWELALGPKTERPPAQRCLENVPDKQERLLAALASGKAEARAAAAEWLARSGVAAAREPLLAALQKEKNELTKGVLMSALEKLGAPVDQFLDRKGLLKEAEKGLAREIPESLKWFPFDQLPEVQWADSGKKVDRQIVKWWLAQQCKLKSPEPGPLLRRYCASLKSPGREALGQFILQAWIAEDTAPIPQAAAEAKAMQHAQQMAHWAQWAAQNPQLAQGLPMPQQSTVQQIYTQSLPNFLREPKGSAIDSKGILAVAAACAGAEAAPVVQRYLKDWYGMRAAHCRALLQMLGWIEHPSATQVLLATGSRFRTKSIQEEAGKQASALAERKGWTLAELADRTIPSAGLDEEGEVTIDFGPRQFIARLNEDLDLVLSDAEGKVLKALPEPRKDDNEEKAAEAKKLFAAAKKELKSVLRMQKDRFYEAMCTQRVWPYDDWQRYLNEHPIVRHFCQRLVWGVFRNDKLALTFRPLADGSLTDAADEAVKLQPNDMVRVAHECQVTPDASKAWRQHLVDYEIEPLFEQFGKPSFALSEEQKHEQQLGNFEGHVLEAFKLRGRATKLGYTRGETQDGGWFYDYRKRFPTLGIEVVIEFTGNSLPEDNRVVALTALHFNRIAQEDQEGGAGGQLTLSDLPPVLLSECWNDLRLLAAEGPGFDPEWQKRSEV